MTNGSPMSGSIVPPAREGLATAVEPPLPDLPLPEKSKASKEERIDSQETPPTPSLNSQQAPGAADENTVQPNSEKPVPVFEQFWLAFAPDAFMSRRKTERLWQRMIPADRQKACNAVVAYLADCRANNRRRVSAPTFLRDKIWQGFSPTENTTTMPTIKPGSPEWNAWRKHFVTTDPRNGPGVPSSTSARAERSAKAKAIKVE
jgi:hypothetical protein